MKQKYLIIFITVLLFLAVPLNLLCWGFLCPAQYEDTFLGELKYKVQLLSEAEGNRIILVGGSSVAFGIDSALMEQELPGYTVVNFGMYAALGTTVMLDLSEELIRPGDIVILMPEQQEQTLSGFFDASVMWHGVDGAFELLTALPREKLEQMAGSFPEFAAQKFAYFLQDASPQPQGVYSRASFNEHGDIVSAECARNQMPGGYDSSTPIRFDEDMVSDGFVEEVNAYAQALDQRGAVLWYAFCPMNALAITEGSEPALFYDALQSRLACPIIGNPFHSILEPEWFYDTNFHLNASGKIVYTKLLIRNIKAMLGDSSQTQIALPQMPEMADNNIWEGDNSDVDCFLYAQNGDAVSIVGLTDAGTDRTHLTVPAGLEGIPVTTIAAGAFSESRILTSVTIQQNIQTIEDGAFAGCTGLAQIFLESTDPSGCRVSQGLLDGTSASFYVPSEALSDYRTNYFWSVHAARIHPHQ